MCTQRFAIPSPTQTITVSYHHGVLPPQPPTNCIYLLTTQLQLTMSRSGSDPFNYQEHLDDEDELDALHQAKRRKEAIIYASAIATVAAASIPFGVLASAHQGRVPGAVMVKRQRLAVEDYCQTLSDKHFRRRYRMGKESFWNLLHIVGDNLPSTGENRKNGCVPNGPISHAAHVSMAYGLLQALIHLTLPQTMV